MADLHFTPVYERARQALKLTRDEYAFLHYVQTWTAHPDATFPGWCDRTQGQIAKWVGITERGLRKMAVRLIDDELLQQNEINKRYKVTRRWFELVNLARAEAEGEQPEQSTEGEDDEQPEQSSGDSGTKFREQPEQSTAKKRNKVPAHSKLNSNPNSKNSKNKRVRANDDQITKIVEYLNTVTESDFKPSTKKTRQLITGRLSEGFTVPDFMLVIDYKTARWGNDPERMEYLRPETLFSGKFEGFLVAARKWTAADQQEAAEPFTAGARPDTSTPEKFRADLSQFYNRNTEIWKEALQYANASDKPRAWLVDIVSKFCARQISRGFTTDIFAQYNARLQEWFLNETNKEKAEAVKAKAPESRPDQPIQYTEDKAA